LVLPIEANSCAGKPPGVNVSGIEALDCGVMAAVVTSNREQWLPRDVGVSASRAVCDDDRILSEGLLTVERLFSRGVFELELLTDGDRLLRST
jgi:hypothetical protein